MSATRTQVSFTPEQRRRLDARARLEGKPMAEVVRDAVDAWTAGDAPAQAALEASFGAVPDLRVPSRAGWDRGVA